MKRTLFLIPLFFGLNSHAQTQSELQLLKSEDLKDAHLSITLDAEKISLSGFLPQACVDRLSLSNVQIYSPSKSLDELEQSEIQTAEDIKAFSKTIQLQVTFTSDEAIPTLKDCLENHSSEPAIEISRLKGFSRTVSLSPELAIAGLMGESAEIKSPEFLRIERQIQKIDCKDCNSNWKTLTSSLKEASGTDAPFLSALKTKLITAAFEEIDSMIEKATDLNELIRIRSQLVELNAFVDKDEQKNVQISLFEKLLEKNHALSALGFKTESKATGHADFIRETYLKMSNLGGIPAETKLMYQKQAESMESGKRERITFLSTIDGDHPEVKKYLDNTQRVQNDLLNQVHQLCSSPHQQNNFTRCAELQREYSNNMKAFSEIHTRYQEANNQKWNEIFNGWDSRKIQYNPQWKSLFLYSNPSLHSPQTMMTPPSGSLPYSNFDGGNRYQQTISPHGTGSLFQDQPILYNGMPY